MSDNKKIGMICVRGLPASYGAFEQTCEQIAEYLENKRPNFQIYVGCTKDVFEKEYSRKNVIRKSFSRGGGFGTILYGLKTVTWCYRSGCRDLVIFGYSLAPFFWLFTLFGMRVICNVDGIEWRRNKWGKLAKVYFKLCERMAVRSKAKLIYDSFNLERYYRITHNRKGHLIFYGCERFRLSELRETFNALKMQYDIEENNYFTCVMRLEPENNIKMIVEGFLKSQTKKVLFIIGPATKYFEQEVLPIIQSSERVIWRGGIYDRKVLMAIRAFCAAYIHGHKVGGTNPTLVEALHLGNKVLAYKSIFNKELVNEGCLFSTSDELKNLLNCENAEVIEARNKDLYTWEKVCKSYLGLLEEI